MRTVATASATLTVIDACPWGVVWAVVLAVGLAGRRYALLEFAAKGLVSLVIIAFIASVLFVPIDVEAVGRGLIPALPSGNAVVAAGVVGGAVHVTLITMQSYVMRARDWTSEDYGLATFDIGASMFVAFSVYSIATFFVATSVLTDPDLTTVGRHRPSVRSSVPAHSSCFSSA